jgi:hypothetical protein
MTSRVSVANGAPSRSPWHLASSNPARISMATSSVRLPDQPPILHSELAHEQIAMHGLDHQAGARAQHPSDLAQHPGVLFIAAERGEEVQGGIEALIGERGSSR